MVKNKTPDFILSNLKVKKGRRQIEKKLKKMKNCFLSSEYSQHYSRAVVN